MKTGIVDVGGGMRGIYTTGVFDRCLDLGLRFDLCVGVSAGSANAASYLAGQRARNYRFITNYAFRKAYMSAENYLHKRSYLDLDYIYSVLSNSGGEDPLNCEAILQNPAELVVVACDARSGLPRYFDKRDLRQDCYDIFKASCAIPGVCRPYPIEGGLYYDGALADPVPIQQAFDRGCDKLVLLLTKPRNLVRRPKKDRVLAWSIRKEFPLAAQRMLDRARRYNAGLSLAREYEKRGKLLIVAPDDTCGVDTLTRDKDALDRLYRKGLKDAERISAFMEQ